MKISLNMNLNSVFLAVSLGLITQQAHAAQTIIVQDTSTTNTIGASALGGSTTDTGQVWNGMGWNRQGGLINVTSERLQYVLIPSLQLNTLYELGVDVDSSRIVGSTNTAWIAMGFGDTAIISTLLVGARATALLRPETNDGLTLSGLTTGSPAQTLNAPSTTGRLSMKLKVENSLTNANLSWAFDGDPIGSPIQIDATDVDMIFLRSFGNGRGSFDNLLLTAEPIPEPSSMLLAGLGLCGMVTRRRRSS